MNLKKGVIAQIITRQGLTGDLGWIMGAEAEIVELFNKVANECRLYLFTSEPKKKFIELSEINSKIKELKG